MPAPSPPDMDIIQPEPTGASWFRPACRPLLFLLLPLTIALLCVRFCFLGRNLKVCKPGQQCERKPEADPEETSAPEGYGTYGPRSSLRTHQKATLCGRRGSCMAPAPSICAPAFENVLRPLFILHSTAGAVGESCHSHLTQWEINT